MEGPNLSPGHICVRDGMICAIGDEFLLPMKKEDEKILDLGEMVLLPGFVNAHCHLELTALGSISPGRGKGGHPDFVEWIRELVSRKNRLTNDEKSEGIEKGISKLMQSGVTCVGDHISFNTPWETITKSPLRGILFGEVLGVVPEVAADIYSDLLEIKKEVESRQSRFRFSVSPHSIHAVHPSILQQVITKQPSPLSCHVAESQTEEDYFQTEKGNLASFIRERNSNIRHLGHSGLDYLEKQKLPVSKLLVVHGNYLTKGDLKIIEKYSLSIVHCPGSHAYFNHKSFPLDEYFDRGINVAMGTDSIASNTNLDFLAELKKVRKDFPSLTPPKILKAATLNGAKALSLQNEIGSLIAGKKADIVGFNLSRGIEADEAPFYATNVDFLMIDGKLLISPMMPRPNR